MAMLLQGQENGGSRSRFSSRRQVGLTPEVGGPAPFRTTDFPSVVIRLRRTWRARSSHMQRFLRGVCGRGGEPTMAGTACGDYAKTKPIRHVASRERKALREMGPGRICKTKLAIDNELVSGQLAVVSWSGAAGGVSECADFGSPRGSPSREETVGLDVPARTMKAAKLTTEANSCSSGCHLQTYLQLGVKERIVIPEALDKPGGIHREVAESGVGRAGRGRLGPLVRSGTMRHQAVLDRWRSRAGESTQRPDAGRGGDGARRGRRQRKTRNCTNEPNFDIDEWQAQKVIRFGSQTNF